MKSLQLFLNNFLKNKGQFVFLSLLVGKIAGFFGSWLVIRLLPVQDFGLLTVVMSVFALFAAFNGLGSQQSLLRYGSLAVEPQEKVLLSAYLFRKGFLYQIFISLLFLGSSIFFLQKFQDIILVFGFFMVRLVGFYFFNHLQSYLRITGNNKAFSSVNNYVNVGGLALLALLTYYFKFHGYLIATAVTPFIALFWYHKVPIKFPIFQLAFPKKELFSYGLFASATALLSDLLFSVDILLLGFLLNESAVANYKVALLIPANLTFLSLVFMQTDFPQLAKNFKSKSFLKQYIFNYYKIFLPVCLLIFITGAYFSGEIIAFFFGAKYEGNRYIFIILLLGFVMNMLLRNLYGNLLSAVGRIKLNSGVSVLSLIILAGAAFILVPEYQVLGMAISLSFTMVFTGVIFALFFFSYYRTLK